MERKPRKIVQFISFITLFYIGIVLLLDLLFGTKIANFIIVLKNIGYGLIYFIVLMNAFFFIRTQRNNIYNVLFVLGALLLITCFILPFVI